MSECPGSSLEEYLRWEWRIVTDKLTPDDIRGVTYMTDEQFSEFVNLFEPSRSSVEYMLDDFYSRERSWRDYSEGVYMLISDQIKFEAKTLIEQFQGKNENS